MQWILKSSAASSFERKWSPKIRPPYEDPEDLEDDVTLVFRKPSWQLRACLASVLITPVLYQLYLIMVTIRYILFLQTFSSPPRPACPVVDLIWTRVFPCELGWRGSALAVLILSAVLLTCYSLITACLVRWNPRKQWNIQYCTTSVFETQKKSTNFQVRVQSTNRLMLPPTLSLCILLLIFRLLLLSGNVEANPGPTLGSILMLSDLQSVYEKLIQAAGNWLDLGLALGLGHDALSNIKDDYHRNKDCLREMLAVRLKTGPLTYSEICQSLRASTVDRNDVAEAIEKKCTDANTLVEPSRSPKFCAIEAYKTYLISTYNVRQLPADERCPLGCVKHFINLMIVNNCDRNAQPKLQTHEVHGKIDLVDKGPVCIEQIACKIGDSFPKLVIIKGAPGVGKTTLSWELCRRWSLGKIWRDYSLVVLLQLRDKYTQEADNLVDLFECGDKVRSQKVSNEVSQSEGEGLLFILEGLDEFPQAQTFTSRKYSVIMRLIHGKLLPASTVVITTRPWAAPVGCSHRIDQQIVVLGFTEIQIQEYIDQAIKDGAPDDLRTYIAANPHINSAMYNPLCARIVIQVYMECHARKQNIFPNTTTELYTAYSRVLLKRYLTDHPVQEEWNGNLQELPESLQPHFLHLCRIAHKGLAIQNANQLIFYEDDIPESSTTLGFMNSVHPLYQSITQTASPSYNFIHLTLQEFLAAFHIWRTYSQPKQLFFIETQPKFESNMIILFLAGLTHFSDPWTRCVLPAPRVRAEDNEMVVYLNKQHIIWLYETQNEQLITSFENVILPIDLVHRQLADPLYFLALGYCIAVGKFMLELNYWFSISENMRFLMAGLRRHKSNCSSQIKVLNVICDMYPFPDSWYDIINHIPAATQGVLQVYSGQHMPLASKLSKFLENVEMVTISSLPILLEVLKYSRTLKTLHFHINDLEITGILNDTITEFCSSLEYFEVTIYVGGAGGDILDIYESADCNTTRLNFGLNIKRFKELNLPQLFPSNLGSIFAGDFTEQVIKCIDHFAIFLIYFGLFTEDPLNNVLCRSSLTLSIYHSSLSKCLLLEKLAVDVGADLSQNITASAVCKHKTLQEVDVQSNTIIKALKENSSVKQLYCNVEFTSDDMIEDFCALLRQNSVLEEICIEVCDGIKLETADINLYGGQDSLFPIHSSTFLKQIIETVCSLTLKKFVIRLNVYKHVDLIASNDTIMAICYVLENKKYLEHLHLPTLCVEPRQRFLLPIANALSKNSSLTTLTLELTLESKYTCSEFQKLLITSEDTKAVGDMLKINTTLRVLHLMVPDIPDWSPIIEGLKLNTTIRELHIPSSARESAIKCIDYVHVRSRIKYPEQ